MPNQDPSLWIGETNLWDEDNENSTITAGSEGSLDYRVIENPDTSAMAAYTVVIFGDLRSFESANEILKWLKSITNGKFVRQGVVQCDVEYGKRMVFEYHDEKWHEVVVENA